MKKNYSTFSFVKTLVALAMFFAVNTQMLAQSCKGQINVTISGTTACSYTIAAADVAAVSTAAGSVYVDRNDGKGFVKNNAGTDVTVGNITAGSYVGLNGIVYTGATAITVNDIGKTYQYMFVATAPVAGNCWGNVTIEDKTGPVLTAPSDITLTCDDANSAMLMPVTTSGTATGTLSNNPVTCPTVTTGGTGGCVKDCSNVTEITWSDVVVNGCGSEKIITRTWRAKDKWGNVGVATTTQTITVQRNYALIPDASPDRRRYIGGASIAPLALAPRIGMAHVATVDCGDGTTPTCSNKAPVVPSLGGPYLLKTDGVTKVYLFCAATCGLNATYTDGPSIEICKGTTKFVRTWTVTDNCGGPVTATNPRPIVLTSSMIDTFQQLIIKQDTKAPGITVKYKTWSASALVAVPKCDLVMNDVYVQTVSESAEQTFTSAAATAPVIASTSISITPRSMATMCAAAAVDAISLSLTNTDDCGGIQKVLVSDSRFTVTTGTDNLTATIKNNAIIMASTSFTVSVIDACGNTNTFTVNVVLVDNVAPSANCDDLKVTLNGLSTGVLTASSINRGSYDNCGLQAVLIRKSTMGINAVGLGNQWCTNVTYNCDDVIGSPKVDVLYVDYAGNYMICCVAVQIESKGTLACTKSVDKDVTCATTDFSLNAPIWGTSSSTWDGCGVVTSTVAVTEGSVNCGASVVKPTKTWTYTAPDGTVKFCTQTITVVPVLGFRVAKSSFKDQNVLCDATTTYSDLIDEVKVASAVRAAIEFRKGAAFVSTTSTGAEGRAGGAGDVTCSRILVKVEPCVLVSAGNDPACKKYLQKITIWDPCMGPMTYQEVNKGFPKVGDITAAANPATVAFTDMGITYYQDQDGRVELYRFITVVPKLNKPSLALSATANCTYTAKSDITSACVAAVGQPVLTYTWLLQTAAGVTVNSGTGATVNVTALPAGSYKLVVNAIDACGNRAAEVVSDVKATADDLSPTINTHNKNVVIGGTPGVPSSGYARLTVTEILNSAGDNCTPFDQLKFSIEKGGATAATAPSSIVGSINFDCSDWNATTAANRTVSVRIWVGDNATPTNWNYALSTITLQNTDLVCAGTQFSVFGAAATENGSPVKDVAVSANYNGVTMGSATSSATGAFNVANLTAGANYQVRAAKTIDTDKKNGVTTLDIALISKHNLGIEALGTAYKVIAADVNKDGEVDGTDMLHIRRFILSITPSLPAGSAWRFIDKSYAFRNAANPFGEDFPEVVNLSNVPAGTTAANFTAVKLGDVNNSFDATQVRGSKALTFNANDMNVVAGNEYTVAINAANFNAAAFQGTFAFEGATVKAVKAGNLNNTSDANFGMFSKAVTASWNGTSEASAEVVNITFVATKSGKLSEMLTVNSSVTMAEGYDAAGNAMNVTLKFNTGKVAGGEFALYQNTPNPVATSTSIGFNLPKDGQAKLTIYTAEGKVLSVINNNYKAGANQVTVNKADLNASGMLYYRLDTQDNSSTRKMIIIE